MSDTFHSKTNSRVNKEVIRKWVQALRSGEYKQGKDMLKGSDGCFCCLGVLCDLAVKEDVIASRETDKDGYTFFGRENEEYVLPSDVVDWVGLDSDNPDISDTNGKRDAITFWNDTVGKSFIELADMIEKEFLRGE